MKKIRYIGYGLGITLVLISFSQLLWAKDVTIVPAIELKTVYDDNLDFDQKDERDSFGGNAIPSLTLNYASEVLEFNIVGEVDVIKYFTETDFDRTNHLYGFFGQYQISPRWKISGDLIYRRDETIDTQLEETGQSGERDRVNTYDAGSGLFYQITELSEIGFEFDYTKKDFSGQDSTDYNVYTFSLPYTKRFANQRDTLMLVPAYTFFDSRKEDVKDYRFGFDWQRILNETLSSNVNMGIRYTDIENPNDKDDDNIGYFGQLGLKNVGETFSAEINISRDIRANNDGEIVEVNRLLLKFDKRLTERVGASFYGAGYLTDTESKNARDDKTRYFELRPALYYLITENHMLSLDYNYQNSKEFDEPGNPVTERNQVWLGLTLSFPQKWNY